MEFLNTPDHAGVAIASSQDALGVIGGMVECAKDIQVEGTMAWLRRCKASLLRRLVTLERAEQNISNAAVLRGLILRKTLTRN